MKRFLKHKEHTKLKNAIIIIFLLILYILISAISYTNAVSEDIANSVFRLHVIANSDTEEDQNLKYIVRNAVLSYMNEIAKDCKSKEDVIALIEKNKETFQEIAQKTIHEQGYSYSANVKIGNFAFPTKTYGDISLPAGYYDALRIEIGEAQGKNWWCVMFPPLCFVDVTSGVVPDDSKETMKENLSEEGYDIISQSDNTIQFKFKIIEMLENVKIFTANK